MKIEKLLIALVAIIVFILLAHSYVNDKTEFLEHRINILQNRLDALEKNIK